MRIATQHGPLRLDHYLSRLQYMREVCKGKRVLHLGCSSGRFIQDRLDRGSLLHVILSEEAETLYGIDLDGDSIAVMRDQLGFQNLYVNDVQRLEELQLNETFDVVVAGDLLEHLTCPGALLDGVRRFLEPDGKFIVSTVNAFGLHFQLRRWMGGYSEHPEHVCFYSPETLVHMFERHNYRMTEMYGGYTEPPHGWAQRLKFAIGSPVFRLMPVLAGTLIVVATSSIH